MKSLADRAPSGARTARIQQEIRHLDKSRAAYASRHERGRVLDPAFEFSDVRDTDGIAESTRWYEQAQKAYPNSYISSNAEVGIIVNLMASGQDAEAARRADQLKGQYQTHARQTIDVFRNLDKVEPRVFE